MPDNTDGFAGRLPDAFFPAFLRPLFDDAWSIAAAGYVLTLWVYLLGTWLAALILGDWIGFRGFLLALVGDTGAFPFPFLAPPLLLVPVIVLLARAVRPGAAISARARNLTDLSLVGAALLAVVLVAGNLIGFIVDLSYINNGFGDFVAAATQHIGALIIAIVAGLWAMGVLNADRPANPGPPSNPQPPGYPPPAG